jgi:hypothetical protein
MPRKLKTAADMAALLDPSTEGWDDGLYWDSDYLHLQVRGSTTDAAVAMRIANPTNRTSMLEGAIVRSCATYADRLRPALQLH